MGGRLGPARSAALMPASLTMRALSSDSPREWRRRICAAVPPVGTSPPLEQALAHFRARASALFSSALRRLMMAGGVLPGAKMPKRRGQVGLGIARVRPGSARRAGSPGAWARPRPARAGGPPACACVSRGLALVLITSNWRAQRVVHLLAGALVGDQRDVRLRLRLDLLAASRGPTVPRPEVAQRTEARLGPWPARSRSAKALAGEARRGHHQHRRVHDARRPAPGRARGS